MFITLQNGIKINEISVPNLQIKKLYIKWDEKININVDTLIFTSKSKITNRLDYKPILKKILIFKYWFESITIHNIKFNDMSASLEYKDNGNGFFKAHSKKLLLKSELLCKSNILKLRITDFQYFKKNITANGTLVFDLQKIDLTALFNLNINNIAKLKISSYANQNRLFYNIDSQKEIENTDYLINLFNIPKEVKYWVLDAIDMKNVKLNSAYGWLDYNKADQAYKNFYATATVNQLAYTYNPKLDAVHSQATELEFKNGVLNIRPKKAYSYGFFLDKSWLKIDFNKKEELLTLFLKFKGSLNKKMLGILSTYHINLPFTQNSGEVNTNLKLAVNLQTIDVDAVGDFFTKKANFNYLGLDIDIFDAYISLNNYDVQIKNMLAKYKDIATAKVDVSLDTKTHEGNINFKVKDVCFNDVNLSLKKQIKPLTINYKISPSQDIINVEKSQWSIGNKNMAVESLKIPFDLDNLIANIPTTLIEIQDMATAYISGQVLFKQNNIALKIDLLKFLYNNIELLQSNTQIDFIYKQRQAKLKLLDKIRLRAGNTNATVKNLLINLSEKILSINEVSLSIEDILNTNLTGYYNLQAKNGMLNLSNLHLNNTNLNEIFSKRSSLKLFINSTEKNTTIYSKSLDAKYIYSDGISKLKFNSLSKLAENSQFLKKYKLTDGNITLYGNNHNNIAFLANIKYPYKILVANNKELENYILKGQLNYKTEKLYIDINNLVNINIDDNIQVKAKNVGINLNTILDILNNKEQNSTSFDKNIILNSKNCYLYIDKNRHIISDNINLQYANNAVTAQLIYNNAKASFKLKNNKFYLSGDKFNDKFMESLFAFSKFKGGSFAFTMSGSTKEYDGTFVVKNTTIRSYRILNNILAFVNTIPSLITFSLPGYNINGLPVKEAYMNFRAKNDIYNISDIYLASNELNILGGGTANIKENKVDLNLDLKTDLGSSASKIPLIGYILFDDGSISTSVDVKGKLDNPTVSSHVTRDILTAPLNIIKRTFELPFKLFESDKK